MHAASCLLRSAVPYDIFRRLPCPESGQLKVFDRKPHAHDAANLRWTKCVCLLISVFLCTLLVLPAVAPLALYAETPAGATCCCKGVCHCPYCKRHHRGVAPPDNQPAFDSPVTHCPCCPDQIPASFTFQYALTARHILAASLLAHPAGIPQTEARQRHTSIRVRQKRGPPTLRTAL